MTPIGRNNVIPEDTMATIGRTIASAILIVVASVEIAEAQQQARAAQENVSSFPVRPVRIIVGSAPGGGSDITARIVAQKLTEIWGRSVIVENRSGTAL